MYIILYFCISKKKDIYITLKIIIIFKIMHVRHVRLALENHLTVYSLVVGNQKTCKSGQIQVKNAYWLNA